MANGDDHGRISVSRDALRAELATMELRLVEKLATKQDVTALEARVDKLERRAEAQDAVEQTGRDAFTKREKVVGLAIAVVAVALQTLAVTGGFH